MNPKNYTVTHSGKDIAVCVSAPVANKKQIGILLTHGAGGDMHSLQLQTVAKNLSSEGYTVIRFTCKSLNIVYRQRVFNTILEWTYKEKEALDINLCFVGGRSMGSRAAVMCCNNLACDNLKKFVRGVICLAYPLHPPQQLTNLRSQPLIDLTKPVLLLSGTKDEMATSKLLEDVIQKNKDNQKIYWLSDGDHSHKVKGRSQEEICIELAKEIHTWVIGIVEISSPTGPMSKELLHFTGDYKTKQSCQDKEICRKRQPKTREKPTKRQKTKEAMG